jgi:hypothetical protein
MRCRGRPRAIRKSQKSPRELQTSIDVAALGLLPPTEASTQIKGIRVLKLREYMVQKK